MASDRQPTPKNLEALLRVFREWEPETYPDGDHEWMALQHPEAVLLLAEIDQLRMLHKNQCESIRDMHAEIARQRALVPPPAPGAPDDPDMLSEFTDDELPRW